MKSSAVISTFVASVCCFATATAQQPSTEPTRWVKQPTVISEPYTGQSTPLLAQNDTQSNHTSLDAAEFPSLATGGLNETADETRPEKESTTGPLVTVTSSLAVVLGLFAALVWATRKFGSKGVGGGGAIPREVMQSLGSTSLDGRTTVTMLRCGNRILVLAKTATGIHPLSEITDPEEVRALTASCLGKSGETFATTLKSIEQEPVNGGFTGTEAKSEQRSRGRLFATA